jgi:cytochrome c biogenesis protein CcdA
MREKPILISLIACLFICAPLQADISVAPQELDLGTVDNTKILSTEITITNDGSGPAAVSIVETCDCLYPDKKQIALEPGQTQNIILTFDPAEEEGDIEKMLIIENTTTQQEKIFFTLHARVAERPAAPNSEQTGDDSESAAAAPVPENTAEESVPAEKNAEQDTAPAPDSPAGEGLTIYIYYSFGCKSCERLLTSFFPAVEKELDITLTVVKRDILQAEGMREYETQLLKFGAPMREFPALLVGNTLLQGEREIRSALTSAAKQALENPSASGRKPAKTAAGKQDVLPELLFFPVLAAGLADGINPCAFSTLIFLIVSLAYVGKNRRTILLTGIFFTIAVFITYFLVGLGFFYILRVTAFAPVISQIIKIVLIGLLLVFACLSIYDFFLIRTGRSRDIILQLPKSIKQRIHKSVREYVSSLALISGALMLGFLVSIFELACTGQIYFPVIAAIVQTKNDVTAYLFLALYNVGFITPLFAVFVLIYFGVSSQKITSAFQKHMGLVKIVLAVVFAVLAAIIIVT